MPPLAPPPFNEALRLWFKVGCLSFGGPAGQIALMHRLIVEERAWVSEAHFFNALKFCMVLPGPEAQQLAIYIGWLMHGTRGGLTAGLFFVLPGLCIILGLSVIYSLFQRALWVEALFLGLKAAVLAIVLQAVIRLARRALETQAMRVLAALAFSGLFFFNLPFPLVLIIVVLAGMLGARIAPQHFSHATTTLLQPAARTVERQGGLWWAFRVLGIGSALWALPILIFAQVFGWDSIFIALAAFFSKMAVITFGGAYAVLAYVAQAGVEQYHWLSAREMLDGLAMAETTPGPLILVLVYVGFLAAFRSAEGGAALVSGLLGAGLTAWVTFLPSFLMIFLGAPYIERLTQHKALAAGLSAMSATVVGVILNLVCWLALHTLFHTLSPVAYGPVRVLLPLWSSFDVAAFGVSLVGLGLMSALRWGVISTLGFCAALGFILKMGQF